MDSKLHLILVAFVRLFQDLDEFILDEYPFDNEEYRTKREEFLNVFESLIKELGHEKK